MKCCGLLLHSGQNIVHIMTVINRKRCRKVLDSLVPVVSLMIKARVFRLAGSQTFSVLLVSSNARPLNFRLFSHGIVVYSSSSSPTSSSPFWPSSLSRKRRIRRQEEERKEERKKGRRRRKKKKKFSWVHDGICALGKPIFDPLRLSQLRLKQFQCSFDWQWSFSSIKEK